MSMLVLSQRRKKMNGTVMTTLAVSIRDYLAGGVALLMLSGLLAGCSLIPSSAAPPHTHYIQIQDAVSPPRLEVQVGDEIRWQNLRREPVRISLLSHLSGAGVSCNTGFTRFGVLDDTATIPPDGYVSLCFTRIGAIQYNVWLNLADPLRSMTPTAKIMVSAQPS